MEIAISMKASYVSKSGFGAGFAAPHSIYDFFFVNFVPFSSNCRRRNVRWFVAPLRIMLPPKIADALDIIDGIIDSGVVSECFFTLTIALTASALRQMQEIFGNIFQPLRLLRCPGEHRE